MTWTDSEGRAWKLYDYIQHLDRREKVPLGSGKATGRGFVPDGWAGPILIYQYGAFGYRDTSDRTLQQQLKYANPLHATAAERMQGHSPPPNA